MMQESNRVPPLLSLAKFMDFGVQHIVQTKILEKVYRVQIVRCLALTLLQPYLPQARQTYQERFAVANKSFLVVKRLTVIPRDMIKARYKLVPCPNPKGVYVCHLAKKRPTH